MSRFVAAAFIIVACALGGAGRAAADEGHPVPPGMRVVYRVDDAAMVRLVAGGMISTVGYVVTVPLTLSNDLGFKGLAIPVFGPLLFGGRLIFSGSDSSLSTTFLGAAFVVDAAVQAVGIGLAISGIYTLAKGPRPTLVPEVTVHGSRIRVSPSVVPHGAGAMVEVVGF